MHTHLVVQVRAVVEYPAVAVRKAKEDHRASLEARAARWLRGIDNMDEAALDDEAHCACLGAVLLPSARGAHARVVRRRPHPDSVVRNVLVEPRAMLRERLDAFSARDGAPHDAEGGAPPGVSEVVGLCDVDGEGRAALFRREESTK